MNDLVVITGASSGIGRATAELLRDRGYTIVPCVRKESDLATWKNALAVILDVTKPETIASAYSAVRKLTEGKRVHLINNAGIAVGGPVEAVPLKKWEEQFDVNVFGLVRITQAFLPLVRKSRGRVINISSISGRFVSPYLGVYAASKFAVEAISDALRREMLPFGVEVVLVEPGPIATPIWEKNLKEKEAAFASYSQEMRDLYGPELERVTSMIADSVASALPVSRVANTILEALSIPNPKARYLVTEKKMPWLMALLKILPPRTVDKMMMKGFTRKKK